jgi:hypothetical protein
MTTYPYWATPRMVFSLDGRWLYVFKLHYAQGRQDRHYTYLATFNVAEGRFLPGKAILNDCMTGMPLVLPRERQVAFLCDYEEQEVRFLELAQSGVEAATAQGERRIAVSSLEFFKGIPRQDLSIALGVLSTDGRTLTVVLSNGHFLRVDTESRRVFQTGAIDEQASKLTNRKGASDVADAWMADKKIERQAATVSPDGSKLYVGVRRRSYGTMSDLVAVLDSQSLNRIGIIKPRYSFSALAISRDGSRLYAISPEQACIMVMDAATGREIKVIYDVGETPARAIVAP